VTRPLVFWNNEKIPTRLRAHSLLKGKEKAEETILVLPRTFDSLVNVIIMNYIHRTTNACMGMHAHIHSIMTYQGSPTNNG
jgi:hypothetical protein